jgi:hypothetical protein
MYNSNLSEVAYSLDKLKGGIQFLPKFIKGDPFIVKGGVVYKRGPNQSKDFVKVRLRDMAYELGLNTEKDVVKAIQMSTKGDDLIKNLKNTGKFNTKKIT